MSIYVLSSSYDMYIHIVYCILHITYVYIHDRISCVCTAYTSYLYIHDVVDTIYVYSN